MKRYSSLAVVLFLVTASAFGDAADDYFNSGIAKSQQSDFDGAIADYNKAIELNPKYNPAYGNRGIAKQAKGDLEGAEADFTKAIELNPGDARAFYNRGVVKRTEGKLDEALADYNKTVELKPDYALAYNGRGFAKQAKGDLSGALSDYDKAIELKPDLVVAYNNRGNAKREKADFMGAIADYTKSIELNPKDVLVYYARGFLQYNLQNFPKALADLRKACELDPSNEYSQFRVWLIRARLGEKEAATKELQTYFSNRTSGKPSDWPSKIGNFLTSQMTELEFFKAADSADRTKDNEQHCEAYFYAGTRRLIEGDKTTATAYFEKCLATDLKSFDEYQSAAAELKFLKAAK